MRNYSKRYVGMGLVEILVTLCVLSVGIVGIATLQATITKQSADGRARREALAIAQARIEEVHNEIGDVASLAQFQTVFAPTDGFGNGMSISGKSTIFNRTEQLASSGQTKAFTVRVTWPDWAGDTQGVSLSTRLGYISSRSAGGAFSTPGDPLVLAPVGHARHGDGVLPITARTHENGDGTSLYRPEGGTGLLLVANGRIVLTLTDACHSGTSTCTGFAKIKGRVWIDRATQNSLHASQVDVVVSDAGFCARHYTVDGITRPLTSSTVQGAITSGGSYEWFDYTCYVGHGWYGNIGVELTRGLSGTDKICVGDPVASNPKASPVVASHRIYRGMLYKHERSAGREEFSNDDHDTMIHYYSHGIAGGVELPAPNSDEKPHDFVIGSFGAHLTSGSNCMTEGLMTRHDSVVGGVSGSLFSGMPSGFICLNDHYLDDYDARIYGNEESCPYDPSDLL